ncbi:succinylglutamate desuccinylase [Agarivorans aestuarii]|uniref:Succinylglutamate desuccinylase n=1 Tax=Agarivorans aestuarii TaxID=1563703 RepID=A0ABU7FZJ6_9ALTE|nr:succinylglutamate desuccinylase [Agarivorans aestuarii]MEE1672324.1 succinylglutamate desuccinylase [Agarivorans aestuarii]
MAKTALLQQGLLEFTLNSPQNTDTFGFELANDTKVSLLAPGVVRFEPKDSIPSRAIVLSAGIHGNETAPIECLDKLVSDIFALEVKLEQPLLVILGNPPAMIEAKRELSVNLNRLFIGKHQNYASCYEVERAKQLESLLDNFYKSYQHLPAYHLDLHTAIRSSKHEKFAVYPFTHGKPWQKSSLALLQACGVDCVLFSNEPASTFSYHSSAKYNAVAFTVELGKVHAFGQNDLSKLEQLSTTLQQLLSDSNLSSLGFKPKQAVLFEVSDVVNKHQEDFCFSFGQSQANFTEYQTGYELAKEGSGSVVIGNGPKAIVFPNDKVAIGQRAVLLVKRMSLSDIEQAEKNHRLE